jgi:large subunit ribosomal protein L3
MTDHGMHCGSLQFYPRVRAKKVLPSVNWAPVEKQKDSGLMGFIGYKVSMVSVAVKDNTEDSMTKGKQIVIPATIIECPVLKIYSVRFYKNKKVVGDAIVSNDKVLKGRVRLSKQVQEVKNLDDFFGKIDFDDVRVIVYSDVKNTGVGKKNPDMIEIAIAGDKDAKINFVKEKIGKDILVSEVFGDGLVDVRGVTKGFGTQGPVKRFGISLKASKSEKGRRRPGSLAPWHPARVTFRAPQMGQTGYHTRIVYNNVILQIGKTSEKDVNPKGGFENYGVIKGEYIVVHGSIPGPSKRQIVVTPALRPTRYQAKKKFEVLSIR